MSQWTQLAEQYKLDALLLLRLQMLVMEERTRHQTPARLR
jgi:hypothetical protein